MANPSTEVTTHDPMLHLVAEYREQMAIYNASTDLADEEERALAEATYQRSWDRLRTDPPAILTEAGAIAAVNLVAEELEHSHGSFELPVLRAVVAYFAGRDSR